MGMARYSALVGLYYLSRRQACARLEPQRVVQWSTMPRSRTASKIHSMRIHYLKPLTGVSIGMPELFGLREALEDLDLTSR